MTTHTYKRSLFAMALTMVITSSCTKQETMMDNTRIQTRSRPLLAQRSARPLQYLPINISETHIVKPSGTTTVKPQEAISMDSLQLSRIFDDVLAQGEDLYGSYFSEGQFVYAHNIRRYIESNFHLECQKVFLFGELTAVSPRYGCCAKWSYNVACVIRGKNDVFYVIDPKLFDRVVTVDQWKEAHTLPTSCQPYPSNAPRSVIADGESFTPLDLVPSGFVVDSGYANTNALLTYYSDSVGCRLN